MHKNLMYICFRKIENVSKNHLYKGTLTTVILQLLSDEGRMYGYEIAKRAKELTKGDLDITEGALYPALHKLEAQGFLDTERVEVGNRTRKYYKLTETGNKEATHRIAELTEYVKNLQNFLNPQLSNG